MYMRCEVTLIVRVFFYFYTTNINYNNASITLTFTSLPHTDTMVGGVQGGASRRPSTNQHAMGGVAAAQPIRPRDGEKGGPHDVNTPPGQSTDLPLVLASDRATSDSACQNRPVRGRAEAPPPSPETG